KAAALAARIVEPNRHRRQDEDEDDDEALFAELEEEIENDSNAEMREYGLQALRDQMKELTQMKANQHGKYSEVTDEKEVVRVSAREPKCVVHFYHSKFKRCEIMDKHLAKIAPKYFNTRFFRVFVENVPWLVERLGVKVLPCVICFVDGIAKDRHAATCYSIFSLTLFLRLIGFEDLGNSDAFDTAVLELRLATTGGRLKLPQSCLA
ncbi:thioredoxin-like protein, partial [Mycena belliarum]